jgi:hypothetical protein
MFVMKDYPSDVMPLYAQGHSLAQWLIESRGRKAFLDFLADGMNDENWRRAVREHYGFDSLNTMQSAWLDWVKLGRPQLNPESSPITQLVANSRAIPAGGHTAAPAILRAQSPDDVTPIGVDRETSADSTNGESRVVVASAGGSVYAAMAEKAERERSHAAPSTDRKSAATGPSLYDASLGTSVLRR